MSVEGQRRTLTVGLLALSSLVIFSWADQQVLKDATFKFGEALDKCRKETNLTEELLEEFYHFWRDDFKFEDREIGCVLKCMCHEHNMLNSDARMHHENTHEFFKSFPNGEKLAAEMVSIIHTCEKEFDHIEDHCWRILREAECFKKTCQERNIAPTMELLITEFIMEAENL